MSRGHDEKLERWVPPKGSFLLTLAGNLQAVHAPVGLSETTLAKQASILANSLLVETGLYFTETDGMTTHTAWIPYDILENPEEGLKALRDFHPGLNLGLVNGEARRKKRFEPQSEETKYLTQGPILGRWMAEFYTSVLSELVRLEADWFRPISLRADSRRQTISEQPKSVIFSENFEGRDSWKVRQLENPDFDLIKEISKRIRPPHRLHREKASVADANLEEDGEELLTAAFREAALDAHQVGVPFGVSNAVTGIARHFASHRLPGSTSLDLLVPNVSKLPWEAICEFRAHDGAHEARQMMKDFELRTMSSGVHSGIHYLAGVSQEISRALFDAIDRMRPRLPHDLADQVASTAVGYIPVIGPVASLVPAAAKSALDHRVYSRSWVAALMELRGR